MSSSTFFKNSVKYRFQFQIHKQHIRAPQIRNEPFERALQPHVDAWEAAGVIAKNSCNFRELRYIFPISVIPKPDGSYIPILNLSRATDFMHKPRMVLRPAVSTFPFHSAIPIGQYSAIRLDLSSYFFHFKVYPKSQHMLNFQLGNNTY